MNFENLLELVGDEPVFETGLLLAGRVNPDNVRLQLSRWTQRGRIHQLRRGLYAIAPPYQKIKPHPFQVANRLQHASYVSGQSALAYFGLIPDTVQNTFSVTAGRPERLETPLGGFQFRHIQPGLLHGYRMIGLDNQDPPAQQALVATPEKALLDLVYLQPGGDDPAYLGELRLQNLDRLNLQNLNDQARVFDSPKIERAVEEITRLVQVESMEYELL